MKKVLLISIALLSAVLLKAQTEFQNLSFEDALKQAEQEKKNVLVDCYTTWCSPCRTMSQEILPLEAVGNYLNSRFVCVQYDMEKTEFKSLVRKYKVEAYPTFLLLKPDGTLIGKVVGLTKTGDEFINRIKLELGDTPTAHLDSLYAQGNRLTRFMVSYVKLLESVGEIEKAQKVAGELLASLSDQEKPYTTYWFIFENEELSPSDSENTRYLIQNIERFRQSVGKEAVNQKVASLYEKQLEDILRGRNREVMLEDIEAEQQRVAQLNLEGEEWLNHYFTIAHAMYAKDCNEALKGFRALYPTLDETKLSYLYFNPILSLKGKWDKKQRKELSTFTKNLAKKVEKTVLKDALNNFADSIIPTL